MILGADRADSCNWLECTMDTDASINDHMTSDEMYMQLQADMVNIKAQEQALQSEISNIKSKFTNLLQTCGLEDEFPVDDNVKMSTPRRPTLANDGTPRRTNFNYADFLIEQLLAGNTLTDSDLSISPEDTRNSAEVEPENLNHVDSCNLLSASTAAVPNQNVFHTDNHHVTVASNVLRQVMPNNIDVTTSENGVATSSDSYPQSSSDSSDNQVVPDLDREKDLDSRRHYYSDFTIDRQRKINQLLIQLKQNNNTTLLSRPEVFPGGDSSERLVEGAEQQVSFRKVMINRRTSTASSRSSGTDSASASSTMKKSSRSTSRRNKTSSSRTISHPLMSSTMISDPSIAMPSSSSNSSVYTWSIDENSDPADLQGSYMRSRHSQHKSHRIRKSTSSTPRVSTERKRRHHRHREAPSLHLTHMVSTIETSSCSNRVFAENNCEKLPRTSTKTQLPIINNSSWEKAPIHSTSGAEFFSIQPSDVDDTLDSSPLQERLDLPGKSSSSGSSAGGLINPSNTMQQSALTTTDYTRVSSLVDSSLIDTVLTDSPADSVNSSGLYAPCNSPRYSSVGSHCGYTTVSSSVPSTSSNEYRAPLPTPATVRPEDSIFKIPHSPIGKKRSSKKSVSHSPSVRTSTPRPPYSGGSVRSEPVMRRKLFSTGAVGATEHKILDKKALVRKFKKFSHHFHKSDKSNKIKTLAQL
ncbi:uncharacterized protein [Haliotis cracherodii]|uniref:uncharacterized protein n=1 Tax=Haliotis cracherodii TaxID=6455 RepID=UPI0039E96D64